MGCGVVAAAGVCCQGVGVRRCEARVQCGQCVEYEGVRLGCEDSGR